MSFTKSNGLIAATLLLLLSSAGSGFAQQTPDSVGLVRISDGRVRSNGQQADNQTVMQTGGHLIGMRGAPSSGGSCPSGGGNGVGGCPTGNCPTGGYRASGACRSGQCPGCRGGLHGKFCEHCCKHSPDYGYSPPAKYPLQRRGVEYNSYYPANWYGAGADYSQSQAPMVYQPTDTTQMGYYYQHVPFWQPMPNRLPERPIPAQWHITAPAVQATRFNNCHFPGYMGPYAGHGYGSHRFGHRQSSYDMYGMTGSCPTNEFSTQPTRTETAPGQGTVVPPSQPRTVPSDSAPQPVQEELDAEPQKSAFSNPGSEPNALPPLPSSPPVLNNRPLPTNSAASGHIKRIDYRVDR